MTEQVGGSYFVIKAPNGDMYVIPQSALDSSYKLENLDQLPEKLGIDPENAKFATALKNAVQDASDMLLADVKIVPPTMDVFGVSAQLISRSFLPDDPGRASGEA